MALARAKEAPAAPAKVTRRRPGQVRTLLAASAREVFCEKGYTGASTREIAERVGVSEALLFRHFKSKANLFNEAVLRPFNDFVGAFVETWKSQLDQPWDDERLMRSFIEQLYETLRSNRELALALIAASAHDPSAFQKGAVQVNLAGALDQLGSIGSTEAGRRRIGGVDVEVAVRAIAGMVVSMALLDPWMFHPGKRRPSRQRLIDEMVKIALYGVLNRPG